MPVTPRPPSPLAAVARFWGDGRGFTAVEFALVLPLLLLFALGVTEVARFALLGLKVQHAADTVADLAAGSSQLDAARLADLFDAVRHIVQPFDPTADGVVIVSGVSVAATGRRGSFGNAAARAASGSRAGSAPRAAAPRCRRGSSPATATRWSWPR